MGPAKPQQGRVSSHTPQLLGWRHAQSQISLQICHSICLSANGVTVEAQTSICSWLEPTNCCMQGQSFKEVGVRHTWESGHQQDTSIAASSAGHCDASSELLPVFPYTTHHQYLVHQVLPDRPCTEASFRLQWAFKNMEVDGVVRSSSIPDVCFGKISAVLTELPCPCCPTWSWARELYGTGVPAMSKSPLGMYEPL